MHAPKLSVCCQTPQHQRPILEHQGIGQQRRHAFRHGPTELGELPPIHHLPLFVSHPRPGPVEGNQFHAGASSAIRRAPADPGPWSIAVDHQVDRRGVMPFGPGRRGRSSSARRRDETVPADARPGRSSPRDCRSSASLGPIGGRPSPRQGQQFRPGLGRQLGSERPWKS